MTCADVESALRRAVEEIQVQSGRPFESWSMQLQPIGGLEGFDSLNAEEVVVILEGALGVPLRADFFVEEGSHRALPVSDIVDRLCVVVGVEEKAQS